ncbi:unnamed protein product [Leptosia nina]|uniref:Cytochrome P450 n=1 Tax=Leptosia nina TaxID=320188 RepID=A0AAV1ISB1_9NEOP
MTIHDLTLDVDSAPSLDETSQLWDIIINRLKRICYMFHADTNVTHTCAMSNKPAREFGRRFNRICRCNTSPVQAIILYNPEDVEIVTAYMKYYEKSKIFKFFGPSLKGGITVSNGSRWPRGRKFLTSAFYFNILRKYFPVPNKVLPAFRVTYKDTVHKAVKTLFRRVSELYLCPDFIFDWFHKEIKQCPSLSVNRCPTFAQELLEEKTGQENINSNDSEEEYESAEEYDDSLCEWRETEQKNGLLNNRVEARVNTFIIEGHDTTAAGLTHCLLTLAENQDIQDKVYHELKSIFPGNSRCASLEDLSRMNYLERCIKETLRLYPPVPIISGQLTEGVVLSNCIVPKGTMCHIHIYNMHRQESLFKDALKFDPDRFLPENSVGRHPYAYIPFSAGPRNNLGQKFAMMEMKSAVSVILKSFRVLPVTSADLDFTADVVLKNSKPVYLKFIKR